MYVQSNYSYNNVNMNGAKKKPNFWKRLKQKALDALPNATIKDNKRKIEKWKSYDSKASHPAINRAIMGGTAIVTQPVIDYCNHKVDEETRQISLIRTIAKIIAGTTVGIAVRGSCYELVKNMTNIKSSKSYSKALLPPAHLKDLIRNKTFMNNYLSALSTGLAILVMCVTNFVIDAPLTVFLTNHFNEKRKEAQAAKKQISEGGVYV